jgi:hypothetical protein
LTRKVQLTAGICAAKALVQHLCKRFHNPENVHIFIPGVSILYRHKFCVQEVLMHVCLPSSFPNAFFGLMPHKFFVGHVALTFKSICSSHFILPIHNIGGSIFFLTFILSHNNMNVVGSGRKWRETCLLSQENTIIPLI